MRPSNKSLILDAAVEVIESAGITAVTFDSIAAASGITRGGIIYHFRSREDLVGAIHEHLAQRWAQQLQDACGKPVDQATLTERAVAYIRVAATSATRAELQMLLESRNTEHQSTWSRVMDQWVPRHNALDGMNDPSTRMIALLAADGLWVNDAIGSGHVSTSSRSRAAEAIVALLDTMTT